MYILPGRGLLRFNRKGGLSGVSGDSIIEIVSMPGKDDVKPETGLRVVESICCQADIFGGEGK